MVTDPLASGRPLSRRLDGDWLAGGSRALFAVTLLGIGITGLITGRFGSIWDSVPRGVPGRGLLAYLCACVSAICGAAMLFPRFAAAASRALLAYLLLWLLLIKGPYIVASPTVEANYQSAGETAVLVAAAWVLYVWLAALWDRRHLRFAAGETGPRLARVLYALALIAFGLSHFAYLQLTAPLVPAWLPAHVFCAYFTGSAYLAAALAILTGVLAPQAAALSALQMGLFTLLVWAPLAVAGRLSSGQWGEFGASWALTVAACVVTASYRGGPQAATAGG